MERDCTWWNQTVSRKEDIHHDQKNCRNPFHFLKRHCKLSSQRITPCPCSNFPCNSLAGVSQDIRLFLLPECNFTMTNNTTPLVTSSNHHLYNTREDPRWTWSWKNCIVSLNFKLINIFPFVFFFTSLIYSLYTEITYLICLCIYTLCLYTRCISV